MDRHSVALAALAAACLRCAAQVPFGRIDEEVALYSAAEVDALVAAATNAAAAGASADFARLIESWEGETLNPASAFGVLPAAIHVSGFGREWTLTEKDMAVEEHGELSWHLPAENGGDVLVYRVRANLFEVSIWLGGDKFANTTILFAYKSLDETWTFGDGGGCAVRFEWSPVASLADVAAAAVAPSGAPVALPDGLTDLDAHGDAHNGPVEIGVGARATADLSAVKAGSVVRSVSVAIGDGADAVDEANPAKQQAIAIGNQSRASAVNAIAIGSGVRHADETDMTGGNAYAAAAQAVAIGYNAKATAQNAWQLGSGVNDEPNTLKFGNTTIVRGGEVVGAVKERDIEKVVQKRVLENGYSTLTQGVTTNGYIYARFDSYRASDDTEHSFYIYAATNPAAAAPISIPSAYGNIDIYSGATVDAKLAALAQRIAALEEKLAQ